MYKYIKSSSDNIIRVYETKDEFLNEKDPQIRRKIRHILDEWLEFNSERDILHDSDIEDVKYALEEIGIDISWKALYDFFGVGTSDWM